MKKAIVIILTVLALVSCDTGAGDNSNTNGNGTYVKALWGEWLRMDTGDKWYISNNALKVNGAEASTSAVLTKQSDRVIEVTDAGRKYYLYASRVATASFTGVIVGDMGAGSARAVGGGLGGVRVAIENLNNKANELTANTDTDGQFTANNVIPGDTYQVTPEGGTPVTVIPTNDGDDIGVVTITSGVNFKTSIIPAQPSTDMTELYINEAYEFEIEFENTGDEDCPAPSYTITVPSDLIITGNLQGILGTIEPGVKKNVPIGVRCPAIASDYEYKKINVTIRDGVGKTWEDSISLRFYKETIDFNIRAEKPVSGIVISPDSKTYSFTNITNGTVVAPRRVSGDYLVVFSGATIETETRYSLGIGIEADRYFGAFLDTGIYEPNDTEGAAVALGTQKIMAYLYKNDIDYYRVSYGNVDFPSTPTSISASATDAEVMVSWTAVSDASSYNVYRSTSPTGTYSKVGASMTASYTDTVTATGTYYYKASAVSASGFESAHSTPTEIVVTGPAVLTSISASAVDAQVTVSWNVVTGANSYNIYRAVDSTGTYTKVGASASSPYIDTVASVGTYYYKASAVSVGGLEGAQSVPTAIAVTGLAEPTDVSASVADTQVTISWAAVIGASFYNVYRSDSSTGIYTKVGASASSPYTETVTVTGTYYYEVSAVGASGLEGTYSTPTTVTVTMEIDVINLPETLSWLFANAVNSTYYTLLLGKDEAIPPQMLSGMDITITLRGKGGERIVSLEGNGSLFTVGDGVTLVLDSGLTLKGHSSNTASLVMVNSGGNLILKDGGEISGNTASLSHGGGVYVSDGTFMMSGGKISGNRASFGGGVMVFGTFTMSGGEISDNTASHGGGVDVSDVSGGGTFTMSGGTISGNTATASAGGGVSMSSESTFMMSGGEINGNTAFSYGGGVEVSRGTFMMSGGKISGNSAKYGGGVIGSTTMSGGEISGNIASGYGGGVIGDITMNGGKISNNTSSGYGGGVVGSITMSDGEIIGNTATSNGGGVYVLKDGTFTMSGGEISGNSVSSATSNGGGVYIDSGGTFTKQSGGIIYGSNASSALKNTATNGHAVYVISPSSKRRNTTAGTGVTLDSTKNGSAGGWE